MLKEHYTLRDYWPLIVIFATGLGLAVAGYAYTGEMLRAMTFFMGTVLVLLASLKIYNRSEFAMAFATYDIIAARSKLYAKNYPFLEMLLGIGYLLGAWLIAVNIVTLLVMSVGAGGVWRKMDSEEVLLCACLGAVFNVPMTWVTLTEDGLMATMAAAMLVILF